MTERRVAQAPDVPTVLLTTKMITELTNAASTIFRLLFQVEGALKRANRERLRRALFDVEVFRNSTLHEEPDDWQGEGHESRR
jgi:hypothetical protein